MHFVDSLRRYCQRVFPFLAIPLSVMLTACGGSDSNRSISATPVKLAAATTVAAVAAPTSNIALSSFTKIKEVRVSRTVYDFTFQLSVTNIGSYTQTGVVASIGDVGSGTSVVSGTATFTSLAPGATATSPDTITLRIDRALPFDPGAIEWNFVGIPVETTATQAVASADVTLAAQGYKVMLPVGAASPGTVASLQVTSDPALDRRFDGAAWMFAPPRVQATEELRLRLTNGSIAQGALFAISLPVSQALAAQLTEAGEFAVLRLENDKSTEPEAAENIHNAERIAATYDSQARILSALDVPGTVFEMQPDGSLEVVFKIFLLTKTEDNVEGLRFGTAKAALTEICPTPVPAEGESDATQYANPLGATQLKIVAPFGDKGHTNGHRALDIRARTPVPVYAVRSGYIETIKVNTCSNKRKPKAVCENADDENYFFVTIRHPDRSLTRYLHLTNFSVVGKNGAPLLPKEQQQYWEETNPKCPAFPVTRGTQIAVSGSTGAFTEDGDPAPHLHFEAKSKSGSTFNPILRLGKLKANVLPLPVSPATTPQPLELSVPTGQPTLTQAVSVSLYDYTTQLEILVRRKLNEDFLPVTALGNGFSAPSSNTDVVKVEWAVNGLTITAFPSFMQSHAAAPGLPETDSGGVLLKTAANLNTPATATATVTAHLSPKETTQVATVTIKPPEESGFWHGSYVLDTCNTPGYAVANTNACMWANNGWAGASASTSMLARLGAGENNNIRWEHVAGGSVSLCQAQTTPLAALPLAATFTRTLDMTGILLGYSNGKQSSTITFTVTKRTPTEISGTFVTTFAYPTAIVVGTWPTAQGTATGRWLMAPRGISFPKCTYPPEGQWCLMTGKAYSSTGADTQAGGVGAFGSCDWKSANQPGRPGEWQNLP